MTTGTIDPLVERYLAFNKARTGVDMKIIPKETSKLLKTVGWLFRVTKINPGFMDHYITTLGDTIYIPEKLMGMDRLQLLGIVRHECFHGRDEKNHPYTYKLAYMLPQALSLLSVLALLTPVLHNSYLLLSLLFLVFLAPIPSFGRYIIELRAYRNQIMLGELVFGYSPAEMQQTKEFICKQLTTSLYYFAWPFPDKVMKDISEYINWETNPEYKDFYEFLKTENLLLIKPIT